MAKSVDAKAADLVTAVGKVGRAPGFEVASGLGSEDLLAVGLCVGGTKRLDTVQPTQLTVYPHDRRGPRLEVDVGRSRVHGAAQELIDIGLH